MTKTWIWALSVLLLLSVPLSVGYFTAPCDTFGEPAILSPYRLRRQRFLQQATRWLQESQEVETALLTLTQAEQPRSMGEAFQLAEQAAQAINKLEHITMPQAPEEYLLLAQEMAALHDTYAYTGESLLAFYGSNDGVALAEARAALGDATLQRQDLAEGIDGLTYSLCKELWRGSKVHGLQIN